MKSLGEALQRFFCKDITSVMNRTTVKKYEEGSTIDNQESKSPQIDPVYDDYDRVVDRLGGKALIRKEGKIEIRIQAETHSCLDGIKTPKDVADKIQEVKMRYNEHRPSELYPRQWIGTCKGDGVNDTTGKSSIHDTKDSFTVMQFNVLAEGLSSGPVKEPFEPYETLGVYGGFDAVPQPEVCLDYDLRQWRLLEVILSAGKSPVGNSAITDEQLGFEKDLIDVIAMEELDRFHGFFEPVLKIFGYKGIFAPKHFASGMNNGFYSDGCCLFWKESVFDMVKHENWSYENGSQIGMAVTLRHYRTGRTIVFTVTHLKSKEKAEPLRTLQASELIEKMKTIASTTASELNLNEADIPMLIMADFNANPVGEGKTCMKTMINRDSKPHFTSVYKVDPPDDTFYTTSKCRGKIFQSIIDYILYNHDDTRGIECTHVLQPPRIEDLDPEMLPGFRYPSDHVCMCAKFSLEK